MTSDARLVAAFAPDGALNITENAAALVQLRHTTSSLIETIAHDFIAICKRINRCNSVCFPGAVGPQKVADNGEAFELTWKFALEHSHRQVCNAGQLPFHGLYPSRKSFDGRRPDFRLSRDFKKRFSSAER